MKVKTIILFIINILTIRTIYGQNITPEKLGWKAFSINSKNLGEVNFYVSSNRIDQQKPVLLYLDGSGPFPLFQYMKQGVGSTVLINFRDLSEKYHIILIGKPGVPFADSIKMDEASGLPLYHAPLNYTKRLSLEWRVSAANTVLDDVMKRVKCNKDKIVVLGVSEGFQVGAKLMSINHNITHAILVAGNGLSQFYDFIIQNRIDAQTGKLSLSQSQKNIDSLMQVFKRIYSDGKSTDQEWYGHTYMRWKSFGENIPMENILSRNIPVYIIAAANDVNTSVLSTDYLYLESVRENKINISYKVYPYDHSFNEIIRDQNGKIISLKNHTPEVMSDAINWLDNK